MTTISDIAHFKQLAAQRAVEFIQPGMVLGLGAGSTALFALQRIGELLHSGKVRDIVGIPCQVHIGEQAQKLGIPLTTLDEHPVIDLTIDGADEVDPNLNLIKGGGGALLREKIVAQASRREIIIVDESKLSPKLGTHWAVPVEVIPFGLRSQMLFLESLGGNPIVRKAADGSLYKTDGGNVILDCHFGPIADPAELAGKLKMRTGIVEHGLFLNLATDLIVAGEEGIQWQQATRLKG